MAKYNTKQRDILLEYFKNNPDTVLSAKQIAADLETKISKSAVYRNLPTLVNEGLLQQCLVENSKTSFYRYIGDDQCKEHLHFACKKCGKTVHIPESTTRKIVGLLNGDGNFETDVADTVIYGLCKNCE